MTARERLLDLVAREVETAAQEGHPTGVKYLPATLDEVRELLDAVEAEARRPLDDALAQIGRFAACHHGDQNPNEWLHGLLVDIPSMVEAALAGGTQS